MPDNMYPWGSLTASAKAVRALPQVCQQLNGEVEQHLRQDARLVVELYSGGTKATDDLTIINLPCLRTKSQYACLPLVSQAASSLNDRP